MTVENSHKFYIIHTQKKKHVQKDKYTLIDRNITKVQEVKVNEGKIKILFKVNKFVILIIFLL